MAYRALYREWRPKDFADMVGQEHITTTLKNAITTGRIAHAYLLCGTRGTGKTTTAKILAKAVNCLKPVNGEPCNECEMCKKINEGTAIDVVEIDAASHTSVDNIRDIIDDVQYPPQEAKFKVYIIDEVHMLSTGAVNAFLKTLEEPPQSVIFILATTDPQKLPITILSRCQRFDFKRIKRELIEKRLRYIVDSLGVYAEDKSLNLISRICDGAMRDAISILDQAISMGNNKIDYDVVTNMLGLTTNEGLIKLTDAVLEKKTEEAIIIVDELINEGKDIKLFIKDLSGHMRNLLMAKISNNPEEVMDMSIENINILKEQTAKTRVEEVMRFINILQEAEENAKFSNQGRIYLELAIIKMCKIEYDTSMETILSRVNKIEKVLRSGTIRVSQEGEQISSIKRDLSHKVQHSSLTQHNTISNANTSDESHDEIDDNADVNLSQDEVKKSYKDVQELLKARKNMVLSTALMVGEVASCNGNKITIKFDRNYVFHKSRLEKEENRKVINSVFSEVLRKRVVVSYIVDDDEVSEEASNSEDFLSNFPEQIINILDE